MEAHHMIDKLLRSDPFRMIVLEQVRCLALPDCWVTAGFIRNMVWDSLHGYINSPLNDVDVIFHAAVDNERLLEQSATERLQAMDPSVNWEVRNQAFMHLRNADKPYRSSEHAMSFWPEKETAIGARMNADGNLVVLAPFGTTSLLAGLITHNPKRDAKTFNRRVQSKGWLLKWPRLAVVPQPDAPADSQGSAAVEN